MNIFFKDGHAYFYDSSDNLLFTSEKKYDHEDNLPWKEMRKARINHGEMYYFVKEAGGIFFCHPFGVTFMDRSGIRTEMKTMKVPTNYPHELRSWLFASAYGKPVAVSREDAQIFIGAKL